MNILILLSAFLATINCLPKPDPYKESIPHTPGLGGYGDTHVKTKYGSFDFDEPSKLEFSEISASPGTSDLGPKDVAAELHAKIEEAAQHALAIIDGAKTFAEEAEKEQVFKYLQGIGCYPANFFITSYKTINHNSNSSISGC